MKLDKLLPPNQTYQNFNQFIEHFSEDNVKVSKWKKFKILIGLESKKSNKIQQIKLKK